MCFIPMEIVLNYSDMLICLPRKKIVKFLTVILKFFIFIMVRKSIS